MAGVGSNAQVGFAEETVWASGSPTINKFIPFTSESVILEKNIVATDAIRGGAARSVWREGAYRVGGDLSAEIQPTGEFGTLLKHALGRAQTAGPSGSPEVVYTHDIFPSGVLPEGLRVEIDREAGNFVYNGMKVNSVTLNCAVGEPLSSTFSFLGKEETTGGAKTAATSISTLNPLTFDEGTLSIDGTEGDITSCSITINNNLAEDKGKLGSKYRAALPRSGFRDVTGTLNMEFDNLDMYNRYVNGTESFLSLQFTSDDVITGASDEEKYRLFIDCPRIVFTGTTPTVTGPDIIYHDMPFTAFATDNPSEDWQRYEIRIRLFNESATI
jgi:hypothetical protein